MKSVCHTLSEIDKTKCRTINDKKKNAYKIVRSVAMRRISHPRDKAVVARNRSAGTQLAASPQAFVNEHFDNGLAIDGKTIGF